MTRSFDPVKFGAEIAKSVVALLLPMRDRIDALETRVKSMPASAGKDGAPGRDGEKGEKGEPGRDGAPGEPGRDGKDGAPGKDGKDGQDGAPGRDGQDGVGKDGPPGRDGQDGAPGQDGKSVTAEEVECAVEAYASRWALDFERRATDILTRVVAALPPPRDGKDGAPGRDGVDGLGLEDLQIEYDGERTFTMKAEVAGRSKAWSFTVPVVLDRGVYAPDKEYAPGDGATFGGSFWIAQRSTKAKPGEGADSGWRLAVKRGRDGKDGRDGLDKTAAVRVAS